MECAPVSEEGALYSPLEPYPGVGSIRRWLRLDSASGATSLGRKPTSAAPALGGLRFPAFARTPVAERSVRPGGPERHVCKGQSRLRGAPSSTSTVRAFPSRKGPERPPAGAAFCVILAVLVFGLFFIFTRPP
ncbi:hypothetical protein HJG60_009223 [Phyllostomus discolor]|uniref:Uncharacterized protein n=1 Tax=Phyllostomus discolor TaxID=89673 RepID=A0A834DFU7_9CHIR|nr:hypothetical protein HJG60_009223 [Phyllostomus discolor]